MLPVAHVGAQERPGEDRAAVWGFSYNTINGQGLQSHLCSADGLLASDPSSVSSFRSCTPPSNAPAAYVGGSAFAGAASLRSETRIGAAYYGASLDLRPGQTLVAETDARFTRWLTPVYGTAGTVGTMAVDVDYHGVLRGDFGPCVYVGFELEQCTTSGIGYIAQGAVDAVSGVAGANGVFTFGYYESGFGNDYQNTSAYGGATFAGVFSPGIPGIGTTPQATISGDVTLRVPVVFGVANALELRLGSLVGLENFSADSTAPSSAVYGYSDADFSHTVTVRGLRLYAADGTDVTRFAGVTFSSGAAIPLLTTPEPTTAMLLLAVMVPGGLLYERRRRR